MVWLLPDVFVEQSLPTIASSIASPEILIPRINVLSQSQHIDEVRCVPQILCTCCRNHLNTKLPLKSTLQLTVNGSLKTFTEHICQPNVQNSFFDALPIYIGALVLDAFQSENADVFKACLAALKKIRNKEKRQGCTYLFWGIKRSHNLASCK